MTLPIEQIATSNALDQSDARHIVLVDTDLSFDDYVALLLLLQHPQVEVRAITIANGVVHVEAGLENCARFLALMNRPKIPVGRGAAQLLSGQNDFPPRWRFLMDYAIRVWLPRRKVALAPVDAPTLIRQQILASPLPVTFVALGPLTNLALALQADPTLANRIETIVISGGAFDIMKQIHADVHSSPNAAAEWNFYTDPLAAKIVLQSGAAIALVPLDVTHPQSPAPLAFGRSAISTLRAGARNPAARLLARLIHGWQLATGSLPVTPVWDAAAAALVIDPRLGSWQEMRIGVVQSPQAVAGQTREDTTAPYPIRVCFEGDQAAFEALYLGLIE